MTNLNSKPPTLYVELAPYCNLKCPNCIVQSRLSARRKRHPDLVQDLIEVTPKNGKLSIIGLGEPLLLNVQKDIEQIVSEREDLDIFVQTNGTNAIRESLAPYIESGQVEIGISADYHHIEGGFRFLKLSPNHVNAVSVALGPQEARIPKGLKRAFPKISRIEVDALLDKENKPTLSWEDFHTKMLQVKEYNPGVQVYTKVYERRENEHDPTSDAFYEEAMNGAIKLPERDWFTTKKGAALYHIPKENKLLRVLIDGTVITQPLDVHKAWEALPEINNDTRFPLKDLTHYIKKHKDALHYR